MRQAEMYDIEATGLAGWPWMITTTELGRKQYRTAMRFWSDDQSDAKPYRDYQSAVQAVAALRAGK